MSIQMKQWRRKTSRDFTLQIDNSVNLFSAFLGMLCEQTGRQWKEAC
jgi:hypothetical protein